MEVTVIVSEPPTRRVAAEAADENDLSPLEALFTRESARQLSDLAQTRKQVSELLARPSASLLTALDDDLAAVAITTIEAMSALRRSLGESSSEAEPPTDLAARAVGSHLSQLAGLTRSTLAIHLTLEAQARSV